VAHAAGVLAGGGELHGPAGIPSLPAAGSAAEGLMRRIRAMRRTEGTPVHRINRTARINRAITRARRIRNHLRASLHASAARPGRRLPAADHHAREGTGLRCENVIQPRRLAFEATIQLWILTGTGRPHPGRSHQHQQHRRPAGLPG
jgi:hypothetical protein